MSESRTIVVYGGLNTRSKDLDRVASAAIKLGIGTDALTYRLDEAGRDPDVAALVTHGRVALIHSMGHLILPSMNALKIEPLAVFSFNPPEPERQAELLLDGGRRFIHHARKSVTGPNRAGHLAIVAGSGQSVRHPMGNLGRVPEVADYSSVTHLDSLASRIPGEVVSVVSQHDEFRRYEAAASDMAGSEIRLVEDRVGCHDHILYDPEGALELVLDALEPGV